MNEETVVPAALAIIAIMNIAAFALTGHDRRFANLAGAAAPSSGQAGCL